MRTSRAANRCATLAALAWLVPAAPAAERIPVVHREGMAHGFVSLRSLDGALLADGDLIQTTVPVAKGVRVTARLVLRFRDGSLHEESTVYLQRKTFELVSNRLVQKGPAFKTPVEASIAASGLVKIRYTDEDGEEKRIEERMELPPDLANGMILAMLKNIPPDRPKTTVSMLAVTPKPELVKLEIVPGGEDPFTTSGTPRRAVRFLIKVDIPGLKGAVASVIGKTPPDSQVWVLPGEAPTVVKAELPLFAEGPTWRIEPATPSWPTGSGASARDGQRSKDGG